MENVMNEPSNDDSVKRSLLAARLDALSEDDLVLLTNRSKQTIIDWRRRRKGPPYMRVGGMVLYPRKFLQEWLEGRVKTTKPVGAKGLL
jgi:hypothetical protein